MRESSLFPSRFVPPGGGPKDAVARFSDRQRRVRGQRLGRIVRAGLDLRVLMGDYRFRSKLDGVFRRVCGDGRAAGRRGADHCRRLLAPQLADDAFESYHEAAQESTWVAWCFHGESIPRIDAPRKREDAWQMTVL